MTEPLQYQVRVTLHEAPAAVARATPEDASLAPLRDVLRRHGATLKCHYDAFAEYVAAGEAHGIDKFPLYKWTRATIEDPEKAAKHLKLFTVHVGDSELYDKPVADALEADLLPLAGGALVARVTKHDTNPANNPQMPERYR